MDKSYFLGRWLAHGHEYSMVSRFPGGTTISITAPHAISCLRDGWFLITFSSWLRLLNLAAWRLHDFYMLSTGQDDECSTEDVVGTALARKVLQTEISALIST